MEVSRDRHTLSGEDDDEEDESGLVYDDHEYDEDDLCNVHDNDTP